MSFTEMLEGVKLLTREERQQLCAVLDEDCDPRTLLPPGFEIRPSMVFETGSQVTADREGFRLICEAAGLPFEE